MRKYFPDPTTSDINGIVAAGGDFRLEILKEAYENGIFPWPHEGHPLLWFSPRERGVIDFSEFKIPKRLLQKLRSTELEFSWDEDFETVIRACGAIPRKGQKGTWITDELLAGYVQFHEKGFAHSLEARREGRLVGGIYGVFVNGAFSAESMFGLETDASKICLVRLIEELKTKGLTWLDIQMVSDVAARFGGKYIGLEEFQKRLEESRKNPIQW